MIPTLIIVSVLIVALVVFILIARRTAFEDIIPLARRKRSVFEKKFLPISDAEFIANCRPGTSPAVALRVRRIVAEFLAVECERIHPSMRFVEDIGEY